MPFAAKKVAKKIAPKAAAPKTVTKAAPFKGKAAPAKTVAKKGAPVAAKKPLVKKPAPAAAKKAAPVRRAAASASGIVPVKEVLNKSQLIQHLADATEVDRKIVGKVYAALENTIAGAACKKGAGQFMLPGFAKIVVTDVPAKKARKGINPFTGEEQMFKAKPATVKVKIRPLKKLKDAALS